MARLVGKCMQDQWGVVNAQLRVAKRDLCHRHYTADWVYTNFAYLRAATLFGADVLSPHTGKGRGARARAWQDLLQIFESWPELLRGVSTIVFASDGGDDTRIKERNQEEATWLCEYMRESSAGT